jgi:hypothetical protein
VLTATAKDLCSLVQEVPKHASASLLEQRKLTLRTAGHVDAERIAFYICVLQHPVPFMKLGNLEPAGRLADRFVYITTVGRRPGESVSTSMQALS